MARIKNVSGEDRTVPALGGRLVVAGAVVEVEDPDAYVCQPDVWESADEKPAKAASKAADKTSEEN